MMLNSVIYPNYISSAYFLYSLSLASLLMTRIDRIIRSKFYLSILFIVVAILVLIGKSITVFLLFKNKVIPDMSIDDITFYKNLGIIIL